MGVDFSSLSSAAVNEGWELYLCALYSSLWHAQEKLCLEYERLRKCCAV
jgi:hypothetical protein